MITMKILIIDDEPMVRKGIIYLFSHTELNDVSIEISEADGGEMAEKLLGEQEFDIVFTDIRMPEMDGLALIEKWRDKIKNTQWVVISGYDNFQYAQEALLLGVKEYLLKPVTKKNAQETLLRLIEKQRKLKNNFISINELKDIIDKLEEAVWTLNEESVKSSIQSWGNNITSKEIEVSYLMNTLNNLMSNLIERLNNRGSILLENPTGQMNGKNTDILINEFEQSCLDLIDKIRVKRKGQVLDPIEFAKQYILDNLTSKITLDDVANKLGLNSAYFSHLFKKETGTTFVEYRMKLRMEKAKKLIDSGNMKITDVASSIGYDDLSHFTKTFKKYTGLSPSKYMSSLEIE